MHIHKYSVYVMMASIERGYAYSQLARCGGSKSPILRSSLRLELPEQPPLLAGFYAVSQGCEELYVCRTLAA